MIRQSPAELYLKYLLVHPNEYTNEEVVNLCRLQQVDVLGQAYLNRLRGSLAPPVPFYPTDPHHSRSTRFMIREKIYRLFFPDDDSRRADQLLKTPRAKETIESLTLTGSTDALVSAALRRQGYEASPKAVWYFRLFYFNLERVDGTEIRALLLMRDSWDERSTDPEVLAQHAALASARARDPRMNAAFSSSTPAAGLINMLRMGVMPSKFDISKMASFTRAAAVARSFECAINGAPGDAARSSDFALVAKSMTEILEAVGSPEEDFHRGLSKISLQTDGQEVPMLNELTGGDHTVDMQPKGDEEDVDSDG